MLFKTVSILFIPLVNNASKTMTSMPVDNPYRKTMWIFQSTTMTSYSPSKPFMCTYTSSKLSCS